MCIHCLSQTKSFSLLISVIPYPWGLEPIFQDLPCLQELDFSTVAIYLYFLQWPVSLNLQVSGLSKIIFPSTLLSFLSHYFLPFLNCQTFPSFYPFPYWQVINEYSMISIPTIITTVLAMVTVVLPFAKYQGLYSAL